MNENEKKVLDMEEMADFMMTETGFAFCGNHRPVLRSKSVAMRSERFIP